MLGPVGKIACILDERFDRWVQGLEARHLAELTFQELSRSVRALSSTYVERRRGLGSGAALAGAGKRAAFALFYGPLHYLLIREIVRALPGATDAPPILMDLGCGIGTSGAARAAACESTPRIIGIDRNPWALREAAHTYRSFGLHADTTLEDLAVARFRKPPVGIIAAFTVNELADEVRSALRRRLLDRARRGDRVLVVEPVSRRVTPWWNDWCAAFVSAGGRKGGATSRKAGASRASAKRAARPAAKKARRAKKAGGKKKARKSAAKSARRASRRSAGRKRKGARRR